MNASETNTGNRDVYFCRISVAGKKVEIESRSKSVLLVFRDYLDSFEEPDITIKALSPEEISAATGAEALREPAQEEGIATEYVEAESVAICRRLAEAMIDDQILLMHGAAISVEGHGYIFMAPSGTGKTTHIRNWLKRIDGTVVINGDKPFVDTDRLLVYGSPWCGKEKMQTNMSTPLSGLIVLERSRENRIVPVSFREFLPVLLQQCYLPEEKELAVKSFPLLSGLKDVPCYKLFCNTSEESALVAYSALTGKVYGA